jgi:hypothetical protein
VIHASERRYSEYPTDATCSRNCCIQLLRAKASRSPKRYWDIAPLAIYRHTVTYAGCLPIKEGDIAKAAVGRHRSRDVVAACYVVLWKLSLLRAKLANIWELFDEHTDHFGSDACVDRLALSARDGG